MLPLKSLFTRTFSLGRRMVSGRRRCRVFSCSLSRDRRTTSTPIILALMVSDVIFSSESSGAPQADRGGGDGQGGKQRWGPTDYGHQGSSRQIAHRKRKSKTQKVTMFKFIFTVIPQLKGLTQLSIRFELR